LSYELDYAPNVSYTQEDAHVCSVIFKHAADQFDSSGIVFLFGDCLLKQTNKTNTKTKKKNRRSRRSSGSVNWWFDFQRD
jgi:hypothetical protein